MKMSFVLILLIIFFISRISPTTTSDNDISRLGGIISVARYNELNIDQTVQKVSGDRVEYQGKKYSSKPPVLNFLTGIVIKNISLIKPAWLQNDIAIYKLSTLIITVIPLILLFTIFKYLLRRILEISEVKSTISSLFLIFGTLIFTYSNTLNNHILVAMLQILVFEIILLDLLKNKLFGLLLGFLLSAIFVVDVTYGFVAIPITVIFLFLSNWKSFARLYLYMFLGSLPLLFIHFTLSYIQFRTFLPPQLLPDIYLSYPGSKWVGELKGMLALNHSVFLRIFNYSFGTYGLFLYQPILISPFFNKKNWKNPVWLYVVMMTVGYIIFSAVMQPDYGGSSFGPRRFLPLIPILYWFVITDIVSWKNKSRLNKLAYGFLILVTITISILGYFNPWSNWNYFEGTERYFYFPLIFTIRKIFGWSII